MNLDAATEPSARTVEGGPAGETEPSQTADEYIKSGQMVLDVLGKLYSTAEEANLCLYCGSAEHLHFACTNPDKDAIKNAFNVIKDCMIVKSEAAADTSMDDAYASGQNVDANADGGEVSDEEDDNAGENLYDVPLYMSGVGDRDEFGPFCIAGQRVR